MYVVMYIFVALFMLMMVYFAHYVYAEAPTKINSSYNMRQKDLAKKVVRGTIFSSTGEALAEQAIDESGTEVRYYPYGKTFAHAIGFSSHGCLGMERLANISLLTSNAPMDEKLQKEMAGIRNYGDDVYTTFDMRLQKVAFDALGVYKGAIVVIEPSSGRVLAMVSKPDFDPNTVSDEWEKISTDDVNAPLLNRTVQGLYPPGSTFKLVTLLEYIRQNKDNYSDYLYNCAGHMKYKDVEVECFHGTSHGKVNLIESFAKSCNCSFANIGTLLVVRDFVTSCDELLFNSPLPLDYSYSKSSFKLNSNSDSEELLHTAIGQGNTLVTPMHIALITCAVANRGILMTPYEIDKKTNYQGTLVEQYSPKTYGRLISEEEAATLTAFMSEVVKSGTGKKLSEGSYSVAGKTGSAEYGSVKGESHAWFTGFAGKDGLDRPDIAVTIIMEGAGSGSDWAVPMAKRIFDAYYE